MVLCGARSGPHSQLSSWVSPYPEDFSGGHSLAERLNLAGIKLLIAAIATRDTLGLGYKDPYMPSSIFAPP